MAGIQDTYPYPTLRHRAAAMRSVPASGLQQNGRQMLSDLLVRRSDGIIVEMSVALGRQNLRMTQQLAHYRKAVAGVDAEARKCVALIPSAG